MSGGDKPATTTATVQVPSLVNLTEADARQKLTDSKLEVGDVTTQETTNRDQVGKVLTSTPQAGAEVKEGTPVAFVVGVAPDSIVVPNVVGMDEQRARDALTDAGFTGNVNTRDEDSLAEEGSVASVNPAVGQSATPDGTITLGLSTGTIDLPDVTGRPETEARSTLTQAGFTDVQINTEQVESTAPVGTVVATTPGAGSPAGTGTRIVLQVSSGPGQITVPGVVGHTEADAQQILQRAGFTNVRSQPTENDGSFNEGDVVNTNPEPGSSAAPDEEIVLLIAGPEPTD
jgi:serine/threonine-protein kinase